MVALGGWACMVAPGGGGMHGCSRGVGVVARGGRRPCVVAPGGHAWLLRGAWFLRGACVVALGVVCGYSRGGVHGCLGGVWFLWGACTVAPGGVCMGYDEIRRYSQ